MKYGIEIIENRKSEECGCPERELSINNVPTVIHFEPDGSGHIMFDTGDWQHEMNMQAKDMEHLQAQAVEYISNLPAES